MLSIRFANFLENVLKNIKFTFVIVVGTLLIAVIVYQMDLSYDDSNIPIQTVNAPEPDSRQFSDSNKFEREHDPYQNVVDELSPPQSVNVDNEFIQDADESVLDSSIVEAFVSSRPLARYRLVKVNADFLRSDIRNSSSDIFRISLFEGESLTLSPYTKEEFTTGIESGFGRWMGKVIDDDFSTALFIVAPDGLITGDVVTSNGRYKIETSGFLPYHFVWQMDPNFQIKID